LGVEYQNTPIRTTTTSRTTSKITSDLNEHANTAGAYLLEELTVLPELTLTGGGRYDYVHFQSENFALSSPEVGRIFRKFTPKVGFAYQPVPAFSLYGNVSRGFETPIIGELRILPGGAFGFNAALDPQISTNYEIGARGGLLDRRVEFDAAVFRQNVKDFISPFGTSPNNSFQNVGDVRENGLELGLAFLDRLRSDLPQGSFLFVLSDFLVPPPTESWLDGLAHGWDIVPVVIQDPLWDQSFPAVGGAALPVGDPATGTVSLVRLSRREATARRVANVARAARLREELGSSGLQAVLLSTTDPYEIDRAFIEWAEERRRR